MYSSYIWERLKVGLLPRNYSIGKPTTHHTHTPRYIHAWKEAIVYTGKMYDDYTQQIIWGEKILRKPINMQNKSNWYPCTQCTLPLSTFYQTSRTHACHRVSHLTVGLRFIRKRLRTRYKTSDRPTDGVALMAIFYTVISERNDRRMGKTWPGPHQTPDCKRISGRFRGSKRRRKRH